LTSTVVVTDLCAFPVTEQSTVNGTLTIFTVANRTQAAFRGTEQDVLSANGVSLMGLPYHADVTAPVESDGSFGLLTTHGVQQKVLLPDGSFFISAGRGVAADGGVVIIPQRGGSVNLDRLCAALAG
jgi:hypothetical protein